MWNFTIKHKEMLKKEKMTNKKDVNTKTKVKKHKHTIAKNYAL